jgi:microsomal dipeptidase-like Zn-dependent dipeptidase
MPTTASRTRLLSLFVTLSVAAISVGSQATPVASAPRVPTGATAASPASRAVTPTPIRGGYVLSHEHPMAGMAFGGNYAFAGAPGNYRNGIMTTGYTTACGGCRAGAPCDHGEAKGSFTAMTGSLGSDMGPHASYKGPTHASNSHLRYATDWIKEAFDPPDADLRDTRMKVMVAFAVESEAMCEQLYYANKGKGGAGGDGYPCSKGDSLESMERQIAAIKAWVAENSSWMAIALTAADARRIVGSNKLAIIIGIESEYSFGAEDRTFDPVTRLTRYYDQGVRTFYLAHKINSRLAGADIFRARDSEAGKAMRAVQAISGCFYYDDNVGSFPLKNNLGHNFCNNNCGKNFFKGNKLGGLSDACAGKFSEISEANLLDYVLLRGAGDFNGFNIYPSPPGFTAALGTTGPGSSMVNGIERNNLGLSHDGERVVREAMQKGMIVNIDHTSSKTREVMHTIATRDFGGYPLNALHNNPNAMLVGNKGSIDTPAPHEYDFDDGELRYVRDTGGFFGVRVGPVDAAEYPNSGVTLNCPQTITETAKILAYLLDKGLSVGYSLDLATTTQGVHSRTLRGCGGGTDRLHRFGSELTEGLSHIGQMKYWHKELETVQLKSSYVDKLKNDGVEQFIQMWERSEAKSTVGRQITRQVFPSTLLQTSGCSEDSNCPSGQFCTAGIADFTENTCKPKKERGSTCSTKRQCQSDRCSWGVCADPDECRANGDCANGQFCGDPISGKRSCKDLKARGALCTAAAQCASSRCSWGVCADPDECRSDSDCNNSQYCADPIGGKASCKALKEKGQACTKGAQCASGRCSFFKCAN